MGAQKFIISASRRTDIPAFYTDWFLNRLKAGYCLVGNPFNPKQISRVSLLNEDVEAFIFWTKNPEPFWSAITFLREQKYCFGFFVTINNYPEVLEPGITDCHKIIQTVKKLSGLIGKEKIIWRYDPILFSENLTFEWHIKNFESLANQLAPIVRSCTISFVDFYKKSLKNMKALTAENFLTQSLKDSELKEFISTISHIATKNDLSVTSCCENMPVLSENKIFSEGCISSEWVEQITGKKSIHKIHKGQRTNCKCIFSKDIGAYQTCKHGCVYCYATTDHQKALLKKYYPDAEKL